MPVTSCVSLNARMMSLRHSDHAFALTGPIYREFRIGVYNQRCTRSSAGVLEGLWGGSAYSIRQTIASSNVNKADTQKLIST